MSSSMSSKLLQEDSRSPKNMCVTSRCLAVILNPTAKPEDGGEGESSGGGGAKQERAGEEAVVGLDHDNYSGKEIWEDFRFRNKTCYWNPALSESIKSLEYMGFVQPCTMLVGGADLHLDNLRTAWGRRALKPPANFSIENIGDVSGIEMQVIPQTHFIPLPEALCLIIMDLNNNRIVATLDTIQDKLQQCYKEMEVPNGQLIFTTLTSLIREGKVFHTGSGYFVVTPDTFRLPAFIEPTGSLPLPWASYQPVYVPVFPQPKAQVRSISCQTSSLDRKCKLKSQRSQSVRAPRNRSRKGNEHIRRSASLKFKTDKMLGSTKDFNLKTSNINQEKNKGEKLSLFGKIFSRYKKKVPNSKEVEYATFSAQFPPPEWRWYQQQLDKQRRTEEWITDQQVAKSNTWHYLYNVPDGQPDVCIPQNMKYKSATVPASGLIPCLEPHPLTETYGPPRSTKQDIGPVTTNRCSFAEDLLCSETQWHSNDISKHSSPYSAKPTQRKSIPKLSSVTLQPCTEHEQITHKVHKSRKKLDRYSYCEGYMGTDDISIEYKGKLPNKYSMYAFSRDSGVNCIGLSLGNEDNPPQKEHNIESPRTSKRPHKFHKKRSGHRHKYHVKHIQRNNTSIDITDVHTVAIPEDGVPETIDATLESNHNGSSDLSFNTVVATIHSYPVENLVQETRDLSLGAVNSTRNQDQTDGRQAEKSSKKSNRHSIHLSGSRVVTATEKCVWDSGEHQDQLNNHLARPDVTLHCTRSKPRAQGAPKEGEGSRETASRGVFDDDFQVVGVV